MAPQRAPLWLLGAVLGVSLRGGCCGSPSHSLRYFYPQLPEAGQERPQFFIRGYLDDQPITRYDSLTRKMEPLVPWMEEAEKEAFLPFDWVFKAELKNLSKLDHHAGRPHTWQVTWGCEIKEDGSKGGFLHYGYNGRDFISFDKETLQWVAAQPEAQKVKEKWEEDPRWSQKTKNCLEKTCIKCLKRYLSYQKEAPHKTEPPMGKVNYKMVDDSLEILTCQAFGFYPKEIQATWTRDGEICHYETLRRNVVPNSDGTYYAQVSIEIDPKERHHFWCHLEHEGLQGPLVLAWKEEPAWWIPVGIGTAIISGIGILFLMCWRRRRRKNLYQEATNSHLPQVTLSRSVNGAEDGMQSWRCPKLKCHQSTRPPMAGKVIQKS